MGLSEKQISDDGYIVTCNTETYGNNGEDIWLIRMSSQTTERSKRENKYITRYNLVQNHPKPFNPSTTINFYLSTYSNIKIEVYNIAGQKVQRLLNNKMPVGSHHVEFNAKNLSSGVHFYQI